MGWKDNILLSTAIPPLAVQEFSTFVHYCGLSVQTFIERGSVMQIPVLYSTNCNYHTKVSIILVVQMVSCSMEVDRTQSGGPRGVLACPVCPSLNYDVMRQVRNTEPGGVQGSDSMTKP